MKRSLKGALFSGLVFPGIGQVVLRSYIRGILMMILVIAGMTLMVVDAVQVALEILQTAYPAGGVYDLTGIAEAALEAASASDHTLFNLGLALVLLTWIVSIVDAYRIGKKQDRAGRT